MCASAGCIGCAGSVPEIQISSKRRLHYILLHAAHHSHLLCVRTQAGTSKRVRLLADATGLYSLIVGFVVGLIAVVIGTLAGKPATPEMLQEFEDVKNKNVAGA